MKLGLTRPRLLGNKWSVSCGHKACDVPGGGGDQGGAPLSEHLRVAGQQDPGQEPHQRHVADDEEHLRMTWVTWVSTINFKLLPSDI